MSGEIDAWLEKLGLGKYAEVFAENEVDLDAARHLTDVDLRELGLPLGPRKKLLAAIGSLGAEISATAEAQGSENKEETRRSAERRLLTVMFCDLVGSTALSGRLDPEDMRDVLQRYQDCVADVVAQYEGYLANFLGDGVLAYFGWPTADEDQAAQAVRAGLKAVEAVRAIALASGEHLSARVGVATGEVVVGDLEGEVTRQSAAIAGETPNIAARLQTLASPNQVVVGAVTQQLIGNAFDTVDLGAHDLKGISGKALAWEVKREIEAESRFDATHGQTLTRFVGRESELNLLLDRWALAKEGEGQVVLISGEPGIGKSRLMRALREAIAEESHTRLRYQCSPYHTNSTLFPVVHQLERAAGIVPNEDDKSKLDKLEALLGQADDDIDDMVAFFAQLLALPADARCATVNLPPEQIKQRTLEALMTQLLKLAERKPVLFLFEDAHWIDPTSQELLAMSAGRLERFRVLMVITYRPEWSAPFAGQSNVTPLRLNRLGRRQGAEIVQALAGEYVAVDVVDRIVARTDCVPLFIEELTKSLVERGLDLSEADIPTTLQASLLARLDRLGADAREVAQIGAVIGRDFRNDLIAAIAEKSEPDLRAALDSLVQSELLFRTGAFPQTVLTFKHALVQDAAYGSLLRHRRQGLHLAIAYELERSEDGRAEAAPEVLARHYADGGAIEQAIEHWSKAGDQALARCAQPEAAADFEEALRLLADLGPQVERSKRELSLLSRLGQAQFGALGGAAEQTTTTFRRAAALAREHGGPGEQCRAQYGLWVGLVISGRTSEASALAREVYRLADESGERWIAKVALRMSATPYYLMGSLETARAALEEVSEARQDIEKASIGFAHDPYFTGVLTLTHVEWSLGQPEAACRRSEDAIGLIVGEDLNPNTLSFALTWDLILRLLCRKSDDAHMTVARLRDHAERSGAKFWMQMAIIGEGGVAILNNEAERGLDLVQTGLQGLKATGLQQHVPFFRLLEAEGYYRLGNFPACLAVLDDAHEVLRETEQWFYEPELLRWRGMTLDAIEGTNGADATLREAVSAARSQSSRSWELRSLVSLVRLQRKNGSIVESLAELENTYQTFTEGFDLPDLLEAKALLDELSS